MISHKLTFAFVLLVLSVLLTMSCSVLPRSWTRQSSFGIKDLHSDNPITQVKAIQGVKNRGEKKAVPDLIQLLKDDDPSVRDNAYLALVRITGLEKPNFDSPDYHFFDSAPERNKAADAWSIYWDRQANK